MSITAEKLQQAGYKITPSNNYIKQNTGVYITWTFKNGDEFTCDDQGVYIKISK